MNLFLINRCFLLLKKKHINKQFTAFSLQIWLYIVTYAVAERTKPEPKSVLLSFYRHRYEIL
jgi:hypothetical protein